MDAFFAIIFHFMKIQSFSVRRSIKLFSEFTAEVFQVFAVNFLSKNIATY